MPHQKLIKFLEKYGQIAESEKEKILKFFIVTYVKKRDILIYENSLCNKLFFINNGLLRAYYLDANGNEVTRRIAWEGGFLTNMESFRKNGIENKETIECIENAEILEISKYNLDQLILASKVLPNIYQILLEKYMAINIRRYQHIASLNPAERFVYFNENFPILRNRINDSILASFLNISRKTLQRVKK